jgi:hypothetical protein
MHATKASNSCSQLMVLVLAQLDVQSVPAVEAAGHMASMFAQARAQSCCRELELGMSLVVPAGSLPVTVTGSVPKGLKVDGGGPPPPEQPDPSAKAKTHPQTMRARCMTLKNNTARRRCW